MKKPFFLAALAALAYLPFGLRAADNSDATAGPVFCRYVPERMDDFAWENDFVAFRAYGPALKDSKEHENSGIDCWFKRVKTPILDQWYAGEKKGVSYHKDHGEGYDGYHVGSSRGCGGTAIWQDGKMVLSGVYTGQKVLSNDRDHECTFELTYHYPAPLDINEVKEIQLVKGTPFFRSESTFTKDGKPVSGLDVAIGVATHDGRAAATLRKELGLVACWETIDGKGVGTGVRLPHAEKAKDVQEIKSATPDESHAVVITTTDANGKEVHYAGFSWEGAGKVHSAEDWLNLISKEDGYGRDFK